MARIFETQHGTREDTLTFLQDLGQTGKESVARHEKPGEEVTLAGTAGGASPLAAGKTTTSQDTTPDRQGDDNDSEQVDVFFQDLDDHEQSDANPEDDGSDTPYDEVGDTGQQLNDTVVDGEEDWNNDGHININVDTLMISSEVQGFLQ